MPTIDLITQDVQLEYTIENGTWSPLDVYAGWAASLGVSSTATLQALNGDDEAYSITLAAAFFSGASAKAFFGSEGGVGLYHDTTSPLTGKTAYTLSGVSRFTGLASRPALLLTWHPQNDLKSQSARLQRSGDVTILYADHTYYQNSTYRVEVALWIEPENINLVVKAHDPKSGS